MDTPLEPFPALVARKDGDRVKTTLETLRLEDLPPGEVLVRVTHSSVNYKDGLGVTGRGKIFKSLPIVPGIDLAGTVERSTDARFAHGDPVLATGCNLGEKFSGGFARYARVRADALVKRPAGLDARRAMALGTAGLTAMLALRALEHQGVRPGKRPVLVTGAGGGVGGLSVLLLARRGFSVAASTGRPELEGYLRALGATELVPRASLARAPKPLEAERYAGCVDNVGGETLATALAQTERHGAVASCGLAGGSELVTTVMPFILRGVSLLGIDSNECPMDVRVDAWRALSETLPEDALAELTTEVPLEDVPRVAEAILAGQVRGRTVVTLG